MRAVGATGADVAPTSRLSSASDACARGVHRFLEMPSHCEMVCHPSFPAQWKHQVRADRGSDSGGGAKPQAEGVQHSPRCMQPRPSTPASSLHPCSSDAFASTETAVMSIARVWVWAARRKQTCDGSREMKGCITRLSANLVEACIASNDHADRTVGCALSTRLFRPRVRQACVMSLVWSTDMQLTFCRTRLAARKGECLTWRRSLAQHTDSSSFARLFPKICCAFSERPEGSCLREWIKALVGHEIGRE